MSLLHEGMTDGLDSLARTFQQLHPEPGLKHDEGATLQEVEERATEIEQLAGQVRTKAASGETADDLRRELEIKTALFEGFIAPLNDTPESETCHQIRRRILRVMSIQLEFFGR